MWWHFTIRSIVFVDLHIVMFDQDLSMKFVSRPDSADVQEIAIGARDLEFVSRAGQIVHNYPARFM